MSAKIPDFGALTDTLGFQLRRAAALFQATLETDLAPLGLRASDASVLIYVGEHPGLSQSEVARDLRLQLTNLIPTVTRLADAGLVTRTPGEGRRIALHLTESGAERAAATREALRQQELKLTRQMSAAEVALVAEALKKVVPADSGEELTSQLRR